MVAEWRRGDSAVTGGDLLAERFEQHRPRLRAVAQRMLGSLAEARDIRAYVFAALRRVALRQVTRRKDQPASLLADPVGPTEPVEDPRRQALARALQGLSHEQREVIALKIEGQLTFAEIGRVLTISANTAASRYRYALARLRERLGDC